MSYGVFSSFLYLFHFGCFALPYPLFTLISLMGNLFSSTPPFESSTLSVSISLCRGFGCSMQSTISRPSFHFPILVWLNAMELVYIEHAAICMSIPNRCHFPTWDSKHQERATLVWLSLDALAVLEHADISLRHPSMDQGALGQLKHPNTAKLRQNI